MLPHAAAAPSVRLHLPCVCTLPVLRGRPSISSAKPAECSGSGSSQTFSARQRQRRRQAAGWRRGHQREAETPQHSPLPLTPTPTLTLTLTLTRCAFNALGDGAPPDWAPADYRQYNFPHQITVYFSLYLAGRNHDHLPAGTLSRHWSWYLTHAAATLLSLGCCAPWGESEVAHAPA